MSGSRRWGIITAAAATALAAATVGGATTAGAKPHERAFQRIATFSVYSNNADPSAETVAEIADVSEDGNTVIYTDGENDQLGFVDITAPAAPQPLGTLALGGEPTAVSTAGSYALAGVNTSESLTDPSGHLAVVDVASQSVVAEIALGGQPDSMKTSPDGRYVAVVIENERDEDITVDGVEGGLPQAPAGLLQIVDLVGGPGDWTVRDVDLTGLAAYGADDPEPEFVDVSKGNKAVVTLQENNHVAVVNLKTGRIESDFDLGTVDLDGIDAFEDDVISFTDSLTHVPREPDAVAWLGGNRFATANEGDLFGGSRGFSVFQRNGTLLYDSGNSFEQLAAQYGHYPENRSENKGSEPEGIAAADFGPDRYLFVGSERGSFVAVYRVKGSNDPEFSQILPTGMGPEGLLPIPERDLLVVTSEEDDPTFGVRANISIYQLGDGPAAYPHIVSDTPLGWSALSGLAADLDDPGTAYAVWDSYYAESRLFTIDVTSEPAKVTSFETLVDGDGSPLDNVDGEGIVQMPDGTFWIASEGNASGGRPNRLLHVTAAGELIEEAGLPAEILACREASSNTSTLGSGFEGVTFADGLLYVAQQRGWDYTTADCEDLDDDQLGLNANGQPNASRIWVYDPAAGTWLDPIAYELEELPANASWVGLSEITALDGGDFAIIERDNRTGDWTELKTVVRFDTTTGEKESVYDLLPAMQSTNGWISDKPEGLAVTPDGSVYMVTDNDGVDDWSGETQFLNLGKIDDVLPD